MADDWIKMRVNLPTDPAVIAMSGMLDLDVDAVVGKLHRVWSWADQQLRSCCARGVTLSFVDALVRTESFGKAMVEVGWLAIENDGISFPNYDAHISKSAKNRALAAKRMQRSRCADVAPPAQQKRIQRKSKSKIYNPPIAPPESGGIEEKIFAALVQQFHPDAMSPSDERALCRCLPDFVKLCGQEPGLIAKRAKQWAVRGNPRMLTPQLLRKHWANLKPSMFEPPAFTEEEIADAERRA